MTHACEITTPLPLTTPARWTPPTYPAAPAQLVPRPSPPYVSQGMNPPPERDCTDMSLTHPDWTIDDAVYVPGPSSNDVSDTNFSLKLTSRATSVRVLCQFGGNATGTGAATVMRLSCSQAGLNQSAPDLFRSQPVFALEYRPNEKSIRIQHDWVCGDTEGKHVYVFVSFASMMLLVSPE
jgi:hypothetical protein